MERAKLMAPEAKVKGLRSDALRDPEVAGLL